MKAFNFVVNSWRFQIYNDFLIAYKKDLSTLGLPKHYCLFVLPFLNENKAMLAINTSSEIQQKDRVSLTNYKLTTKALFL